MLGNEVNQPTLAPLGAVAHGTCMNALPPIPALDKPIGAVIRRTEGRVLVGAIRAVKKAVAGCAKVASSGVAAASAGDEVVRAGVGAAEGRVLVASIGAGGIAGQAEGGGGGALAAVRAHELQRGADGNEMENGVGTADGSRCYNCPWRRASGGLQRYSMVARMQQHDPHKQVQRIH